MSDRTGENLLRLMAELGLSIHHTAQKTGLDERTLRAILRGSNRPHPRTLHRLAEGLGVRVDEFFVEPAQLLYRHFDRQTNPLVEEVIQHNREVFADWTEADFDELHSRMGSGGALSRDGTLKAAEDMNRKRQLHEKLSLLLESSQAELIGGIIEVAYDRVVVDD